MKNIFKSIGRNIRAMDRLTRVVFAVFLVLALVTGVVAFNLARNLTSSMTILNLPGIALDNGQTTVQPGAAAASGSQASAITPEPWDGTSRVTVLIMGLDYRDWQSGDTPHSDTMILLSVDPIKKTAAMLSLPRDLWVNIPGFDYGRINEAYFNGAGI